MKNKYNRHSKHILKPDGRSVSYPSHKYSYYRPIKMKSRLRKKLDKYEYHNEALFQIVLDTENFHKITLIKNYPIKLDKLPNGKDFNFDFDSDRERNYNFYDELDFYWQFHGQIQKRAPRWRQIVLSQLKETENENN